MGNRTGIRWAAAWIAGVSIWGGVVTAQNRSTPAPVIAAQSKGPDQINLTWPAMAQPGDGYLVEVQSESDRRYGAWTEMQPVREAGGFVCDSSVVFRNARCNISDPSGAQVYNPPNRGIPYWVTDVNYSDPQDGSPAQFIAWGLKPDTDYRFRVRTYSGQTSPAYGSYSTSVTSRTAAYPVRHVSPGGNDANSGADPAHAWRTLRHATAALKCGEVLIVAGGTYATDTIRMDQKCSPEKKAVVLVNPGEAATLTSQPPNTARAMELNGDHLVIDGLEIASPGTAAGEYDVEVRGSYNALLNVEFHPPVVPSFNWGVVIQGHHNLLYRSYLHDYGSPDGAQNNNGNGGFVLAVRGGGAFQNVIWSNHLTRGGHDSSFCGSGSHTNRWLNNVMDGGWGQGLMLAGAGRNLAEGNVIKGIGQLVSFYKPSIQVSSANNTIRRNVVINSRSFALEVGVFGGGEEASGSLIYNNVFYNPTNCYFQSSSRGERSYYHVVYANNICYRIHEQATRIYLGNRSNRNVNNSFLFVDNAGKPAPERPLVAWNLSGGKEYESNRTLAVADRTYGPVFSRNASLSVLPGFRDETNLDFHLAESSPLRDAGIAIVDPMWGWSTGPVDLGSYGLTISGDYVPRTTPSEETLLQELRAAKNVPHAAALEAAFLRTLDDDEGAAAVLRKMPQPRPQDLPERFERVRQDGEDPAFWETLGAQPDTMLAMADTYLRWGLVREALEILAHKYPPGTPALSHALVQYYRAYCHDLLGYPYYVVREREAAAALPVKDVSPRGAIAAGVLRHTLRLDPTDGIAQYLLAVLQQNEGHAEAAKESLRMALQLKPGHPEATALLVKLGGTPPAAHVTPPPAAPQTAPMPPTGSVSSPREIAARALLSAASGDLVGAMRYFTPANFPKDKQEDAVREAYIELRLQRLLALAAARQCNTVAQGITHLGDEDKALPFTFEGFGRFTGGARFQYLLGVAEFVCVDENAARKRWAKVAKSTPPPASPDYVYAILATLRKDQDEGQGRAKLALQAVRQQLDGAASASKGILLYNQGVLLAIAGKREEAVASFRAGAEAGPPGMAEYLNRDAIRTIDLPR